MHIGGLWEMVVFKGGVVEVLGYILNPKPSLSDGC